MYRNLFLCVSEVQYRAEVPTALVLLAIRARCPGLSACIVSPLRLDPRIAQMFKNVKSRMCAGSGGLRVIGPDGAIFLQIARGANASVVRTEAGMTSCHGGVRFPEPWTERACRRHSPDCAIHVPCNRGVGESA